MNKLFSSTTRRRKEEGNTVVNKECLHSYCKECIEQSASTSLLCPICHSSLPTPLSSGKLSLLLSLLLIFLLTHLKRKLKKKFKKHAKIAKKRKQKFITLNVIVINLPPRCFFFFKTCDRNLRYLSSFQPLIIIIIIIIIGKKDFLSFILLEKEEEEEKIIFILIT